MGQEADEGGRIETLCQSFHGEAGLASTLTSCSQEPVGCDVAVRMVDLRGGMPGKRFADPKDDSLRCLPGVGLAVGSVALGSSLLKQLEGFIFAIHEAEEVGLYGAVVAPGDF